MKTLIFIAGLIYGLQASAVQPENLYGYSPDRNGIAIQVFSGGCTSPADFYVGKERLGGVVKLTFYRLQMDTCLAHFPYGRKIHFSYEELGVDPKDLFQISNSIGVLQRASE